MIPMLLFCLNNLQANDNDTIPLRGSYFDDSLKVLIPITNIRNANAKLIERTYLIDIVKNQDTIINEQRKLIDTLYIINKEYQYDNLHLRILNSNIEDELNRKNKVIFNSITISAVVGFILGLIIK